MQGPVVLLIALSGLGCDHKSCGVFPAPAALDGHYGAHAYFLSPALSGYPAYSPSPYSCGDASGHSRGANLRGTLCSFVLGRDPDVPTAREIQATFNWAGYGQYRDINLLPSARRPPSE
jgi:hypothetical protein